jgi:hypothetical protein
MKSLSHKTRGRLEMQGYRGLDDAHLIEISPWVRVVPATLLGWTAVGTLLGSPAVFWVLTPFALLGALPHHPLEAVYDRWLRHVLGTRALPAGGVPRRVAFASLGLMLCGAGTAFALGSPNVGRLLGVVVLVSESTYLSTLLCPVSALLALLRRALRR